MADGVAFVLGAPSSGYLYDPPNNDYSEMGLKSGLAITFDTFAPIAFGKNADGSPNYSWPYPTGQGAISVRVDGVIIRQIPVDIQNQQQMQVGVSYNSSIGLSLSVTGGLNLSDQIAVGSLQGFSLDPSY